MLEVYTPVLTNLFTSLCIEVPTFFFVHYFSLNGKIFEVRVTSTSVNKCNSYNLWNIYPVPLHGEPGKHTHTYIH